MSSWAARRSHPLRVSGCTPAARAAMVRVPPAAITSQIAAVVAAVSFEGLPICQRLTPVVALRIHSPEVRS